MTHNRKRPTSDINIFLWNQQETKWTDNDLLEMFDLTSPMCDSPTFVIGLCTALMMFLVPLLSQGGTIYVNPDVQEPGDGTKAKPYRSLKKGTEAAKAGDTIHAKPGTYSEAMTINKRVTIDTGRAPYDSNPCVPDVPAAFEKIQNYGQRSGVWIDKWRPHFEDHDPVSGFSDIRFKKQSHMQGIQRLRNKPYVIVTANSQTGGNGLFYVGQLTANSAGRFESNLNPFSIPSKQDRVVHREDLDVIEGTFKNNSFVKDQKFTKKHDYHHAGGMQVIGDYVAIALGHGKQQRVVFYDLSNPVDPVKLGYELLLGRADAVGVAKPKTDYVVVVRQDPDRLSFFSSTTGNLTAPNFTYKGDWVSSQLKAGPSDNKWRNYQNINLVSSCAGQLYLTGFARKKGGLVGDSGLIKIPLTGDDWMDLYLVENYDTQPIITKIATKHMYCSKYCNFAAGGGIYVTDQGDLMAYGVRHFVRPDLEEYRLHGMQPNISSENDGHIPIDTAFIRLNEFRSFSAPLSPTNVHYPWVALYDDAHFDGPRIIFEGADVKGREWTNYKKIWGNFNDKVSSVRWAIPDGYQYGLYRHSDFKGEVLWLKGNGQEQRLSRLRPLGFNDAPSSSKLLKMHITNPKEGWVELYSKRNFKGGDCTCGGAHRLS